MVGQFNQILGRLVRSPNLQSPLFPISPLPLEKQAIVQVQYDPRYKLSNITQGHVTRNATTATRSGYAPLAENIRKGQELFQAPNDIPVHLKGGAKDRILFGFTAAMTVVMTVISYYTLISNAFTKKK